MQHSFKLNFTNVKVQSCLSAGMRKTVTDWMLEICEDQECASQVNDELENFSSFPLSFESSIIAVKCFHFILIKSGFLF